jgi:hypothetical protein
MTVTAAGMHIKRADAVDAEISNISWTLCSSGL